MTKAKAKAPTKAKAPKKPAKKSTAKKAPAKRKKTTPKGRLAAAQAAIKKAFGAQSAIRLSDGYRGEVVASVPSGLDCIDHFITGCGGLPIGRIVELFSEEGMGKSALALGMVGAAQRGGYAAVMVETENGISEERALTYGVQLEDLLILQPDYLEQALKQIEMLLDAVDPSEGETLVVWDSLAATPTKAEIDTGIIDKAAQDARAILMSRAMRIFQQRIMSTKICLVIVNQTRHKRGVMFGDPMTTPGGSAVKFHASLRLQLMGGKATKDAMGNHISKDLTLFVKKNRFVPPFRKCRIRLDYVKGWDNDWSNLSLAKDWEIISSKSRDAEAAKAALEGCNWDPRNAKDYKASLKDADKETSGSSD